MFFILWAVDSECLKKGTLHWQLFRILCIVQLIMVLYSLIINVSRLFDHANTLSDIVSVVSYALVALFLFQGLSILQDNYPDSPLNTRQKRRFNVFFLINFLLIAFLFAKTVQVWQILPLINFQTMVRNNMLFTLIFYIFQSIVVFIFHLVFLYGMYRLRKQIYENTVTGWYNQFDQQEQQP